MTEREKCDYCGRDPLVCKEHGSYAQAVFAPLVLTPEDEEKILHLLTEHDVQPDEILGDLDAAHKAVHPEPPSYGVWQVNDTLRFIERYGVGPDRIVPSDQA